MIDREFGPPGAHVDAILADISTISHVDLSFLETGHIFEPIQPSLTEFETGGTFLRLFSGKSLTELLIYTNIHT